MADSRHETGSPLRTALVEVVKAALVSDEAFGVICRERAAAALSQAGGAADLSAGSWDLAVREAEADPEIRRREDVNPMLPTTCPIDLRSLGSPDFDFDAAVQMIRESSSFG